LFVVVGKGGNIGIPSFREVKAGVLLAGEGLRIRAQAEQNQ
jgi:hypothetical protein